MIDYEHQTLVNITNELFERVHSKAYTDEEIAQVIALLVDYVKRHFAREEAIFMKTDYPEKDAHRRKHREISATVANIAERYKTDPGAINMEEVLEFLRVWLTKHILRTDQSYIDYIET